jgi:hypothetical protein
MARAVQSILLIVTVLIVCLAGSAAAKVKTSKHDTTIIVHHVSVTAKGRILANGILRSDGPICREFNFVSLLEVSSGPDPFLDGSASSVPHGAWATRTDTGVADGGPFYVQTQRNVIESERIGPGGRHHHRRKIVCRGDRASLQLPATG